MMNVLHWRERTIAMISERDSIFFIVSLLFVAWYELALLVQDEIDVTGRFYEIYLE
jgi:hypothetical protein